MTKSVLTLACAIAILFSDATASVVASVYCEPQRVACGGGRFAPNGLTVAHKSLPCGTVVRISHGNRSVLATVTDRGPYVKGREVDLSCGTARAVGVSGVMPVEMNVVSLGYTSARHHTSRHHHRVARRHHATRHRRRV